VIGGYVIVQEQGRLALDRGQRRIGPGLVLSDGNLILHRSVHR
jgi:hypothetical protein